MKSSVFRILVRPSPVGVSHLVRSFLIAEQLRTHDVDCVVACKQTEGLSFLGKLKLFPVMDIDISDFGANVFEAYSRELIDGIVDQELKLIDAVKPQALLGDFCLTGAISSRIAGIPYISVVNGYMTDCFDPVDAMIPAERTPVKHRIASVLGRGIQYVQKRSLATEFRHVARSRGIKDLVSLYGFLRGDLTLIADLPEFCPLHGLPANFHYVGPLIWEGADSDIPESMNKLQRSRRVIYATTGNTGSQELIQLVYGAFAGDRSYQVIVTTGAYIDPRRFPVVDNFIVERFIPGSKILGHCDAVIHCGGNGTTYQAMSHGVPAVVVPYNNDQRINAWLIKRSGVGIPLSPNGLSGTKLKSAVETLLRDVTIEKNVQRFQEMLVKVDGPRNAAEKIVSFLNPGPRK
jgi:MGT family glycosyltransferase